MILSEETYNQSVVYCSEKDEWQVNQAVKEYERCRAVCISYQKSMQNYRILYIAVNFFYLFGEHWIKYPIIALYMITAFLFAAFQKNLIAASLSSLILLVLINKADAFSIIPVWGLFACNGVLAYLHEKKQRYISRQHGYPLFRPLVVRVIKDDKDLSENTDMPSKMEQL